MQKVTQYVCLLWISTWLLACNSNKDNTQENTPDTPTTTINGKEITIEGETSSSQKGLIILKRIQDNTLIAVDSAQVSGTRFQLKTRISEPDFYMLNIFGQRDVPLVLNDKQATVKVKIDTKNPDFGVQFSDSKDTDDYYALEAILKGFTANLQALEQKYSEQPAQLQKAYTELQQASVKKVKAFIDSIGPSIVAFRASSVLAPEEEAEYLNAFNKKMQTALPESKYTQQLALKVQAINQELAATQHLQVGKPAPDIKLNSPEGTPITLSSLKGKVVLIDFWASWCGPCRQENPNVVKMYQQYKNKGFEIYGVSLDKNREDWLAAIEEDQLAWLHVSDLQFWNSAAAQTYNVRAIPATYLIGKDGIILAKNLRGPALEAKVAEVLEASM